MFQHQLHWLQILSPTHNSDNHFIATDIQANTRSTWVQEEKKKDLNNDNLMVEESSSEVA